MRLVKDPPDMKFFSSRRDSHELFVPEALTRKHQRGSPRKRLASTENKPDAVHEEGAASPFAQAHPPPHDSWDVDPNIAVWPFKLRRFSLICHPSPAKPTEERKTKKY